MQPLKSFWIFYVPIRCQKGHFFNQPGVPVSLSINVCYYPNKVCSTTYHYKKNQQLCFSSQHTLLKIMLIL